MNNAAVMESFAEVPVTPAVTANVTEKPVMRVVPPAPTEPPTLPELMKIYSNQHRECWLCQGIAKKIEEGADISEDDNWHFTTCVLTWEHLNH